MKLNRGEYSIVQIKVTAITREDSLLIPRGDSQILVDDEILALTDEASSIELIEIFGEH